MVTRPRGGGVGAGAGGSACVVASPSALERGRIGTVDLLGAFGARRARGVRGRDAVGRCLPCLLLPASESPALVPWVRLAPRARVGDGAASASAMRRLSVASSFASSPSSLR